MESVWPEIVGSVFGRFSAKLGPKTPLERRGARLAVPVAPKISPADQF